MIPAIWEAAARAASAVAAQNDIVTGPAAVAKGDFIASQVGNTGSGYGSPPASIPNSVQYAPPSESDPRIAELERQMRELLDAQQAAERQAREAASAFLKNVLAQYGMESLSGQVDNLVKQWGNNTDVISIKLKDTTEYKDRFKGLIGLQQKGVTDVRNEAEYLNLESSYRQVFRDAGIQSYLGAAGSATERDAIAKIVGDFSLSVNEVKDRVTDAQRVVAETPQEVRDSLQRFYGVDPAMLTQYVLDPNKTSTEIQRRANAAIVGGYATRAGLDIGANVSERIGEFLGGERDITGTQIEPVLTDIADIQKTTKRLAEIEGGTLTAEQTALGTLDLEEAQRTRIKTLQSRERARFGGKAGVTSQALKRARSI